MANYTIPENVRKIILECKVTETAVALPERQLDREEYEQFDKAMRNLGGKWKRGKGHVFESDPRPKIATLLETNVAVDEKKKFQAFYTPAALAKQVVDLAEVGAGDFVLEPSAGAGAIVAELLERSAIVTAVEINPEAISAMRKRVGLDDGKLFTIYEGDFLKLSFKSGDFDRVVMNPPFTKGQDLTHIERAFELLRPGGVLVSIMAPKDERLTRLRVLRNQCTDYEQIDVEAGAFKESGTEIATQILRLEKA